MDAINYGILEYLKVFFRRKWFMIIPPLLGVTLGICLSFILPKEYISSMKILVQEEKNDNPLLSNIAVSTSAEQRMQTIRETMLGWDSLHELIKRLHLDRNIHSPAELEQYIRNLQDEIEFRPQPESGIIEISYVSKDPKEAQAVVKTISDIFIGKNLIQQNQETANAIKFIEQQLHVYLGKIKSAEIAELKDRLNALLIDSTEMHPQVKELRAEIAKKMQQLHAQNLQYTEDEKLNADTTNPMILQIQQALASLGPKAMASPEASLDANPNAAAVAQGGADKDLYKVMLMDKIDTVMARDVSVNENIYNNLLQRLETAKITQRLQSSKEGTQYTIIEDARLPTKPIKPNKIVVSLLGLFAGVVVGIGLILMMELLDKSFLDVREASIYLNVPLLGAISKIDTEDTIRDNKDAQLHLTFWMMACSVLLVSLTIMFVNVKIY